MQIDPRTDILGLIDVQPTFMPGGELPVADGDAIIPVINRLLTGFGHAFATQDWHPAHHTSFASAHPGCQPYDVIEMTYGKQVLWPDHGIAGTPDAAIHSAIDQTRIEVVIRKGFRSNLDSYSAFFENDRKTPTGLDGWLRQRGFGRLFLCGLATDFCVAWSAEDAARLGYSVTVIEDACRGIGLPAPDGRTPDDRTITDEARGRTTMPEARSRTIMPEARSRTIMPEARSRTIMPEARSRTIMPEARSRTTMDVARDRLTALGVRFIDSGTLQLI